MDRGVVANLERAPAPAGADDPGQLARRRALSQVAAASGVLERNLQLAPQAAQPGLRRAFEASRAGRQRALEAGVPHTNGKEKGKGGWPQLPPWAEKNFKE
jgi:hypothetical protein